MMPLKNLDYSGQDFADQRMVRAIIDFLLSLVFYMYLLLAWACLKGNDEIR